MESYRVAKEANNNHDCREASITIRKEQLAADSGVFSNNKKQDQHQQQQKQQQHYRDTRWTVPDDLEGSRMMIVAGGERGRERERGSSA